MNDSKQNKRKRIWAESSWDGLEDGALHFDAIPTFTYRTIEPKPIRVRAPVDGRLATNISDGETTE